MFVESITFFLDSNIKFHAKRFNLRSFFNNYTAHCTCLVGTTKVFFVQLMNNINNESQSESTKL